MAQDKTLGLLREANKPLRPGEILQAAWDKGYFLQGKGRGPMSRDLAKLLEKKEIQRNEDGTYQTSPKTPAPEAEKPQVSEAPKPEAKEVRLRINVTKGAETGHTDTGVDGPYTDPSGHDVNTKQGCKKCGELLRERREAKAPATPSGMTPEQFDELVYKTFQDVETQDAMHVAFALGRAGVLQRVSQTPMVIESFRRLVKEGRIRKT